MRRKGSHFLEHLRVRRPDDVYLLHLMAKQLGMRDSPFDFRVTRDYPDSICIWMKGEPDLSFPEIPI